MWQCFLFSHLISKVTWVKKPEMKSVDLRNKCQTKLENKEMLSKLLVCVVQQSGTSVPPFRQLPSSVSCTLLVFPNTSTDRAAIQIAVQWSCMYKGSKYPTSPLHHHYCFSPALPSSKPQPPSSCKASSSIPLCPADKCLINIINEFTILCPSRSPRLFYHRFTFKLYRLNRNGSGDHWSECCR